MVKPKYNINVTSSIGTVEPAVLENIIEGSSCSFTVDFGQEVEACHLIINNEEQTKGIPQWIKYTKLSANLHHFELNGVTQDYTIEVIAD